MKQVLYLSGMLIVLAFGATPLLAGTVLQVPEIDGGTITTGLGLLTGAVLLLRARLSGRNRKAK